MAPLIATTSTSTSTSTSKRIGRLSPLQLQGRAKTAPPRTISDRIRESLGFSLYGAAPPARQPLSFSEQVQKCRSAPINAAHRPSDFSSSTHFTSTLLDDLEFEPHDSTRRSTQSTVALASTTSSNAVVEFVVTRWEIFCSNIDFLMGTKLTAQWKANIDFLMGSRQWKDDSDKQEDDDEFDTTKSLTRTSAPLIDDSLGTRLVC
jgi:hypothetical protein